MARRETPATATTPADAGFPVLRSNLVPRSLKSARASRRARRRAVFMLVAALAVSLGLGGVVGVGLVTARVDRDEAVATQAELIAVKGSFVELSQLDNELVRLRDIEKAAMERDVDWSSYVYEVSAALLAVTPPEVVPGTLRIEGVQITSTTSESEPAEGQDVLGIVGIGTMTFTVFSPTMPDAGAWTSALNGIVGLGDARISSGVLEQPDEEGEGEEGYTVMVTVTVTQAAQSCRWAEPAPTEEPESDTGDAGTGDDNDVDEDVEGCRG